MSPRRALCLLSSLLAALLVAGCYDPNPPLRPGDTVDACGGAPAGVPCVTLHVHGVDLTEMDNIQVDLTYWADGKIHGKRVVSRGAAPALQPIALGIILPQNASSLTFLVVGRLGEQAVGIGETEIIVIQYNRHYATDVDLIPYWKSKCFDSIQDGSETDIDCGGPYCPSCTLGRKCSTALDCTGSTCTSQPVSARCL